MPESDARNVFGGRRRKPILGVCLEDGAGNRCSECVIRTVPESDVRSVEGSAGSRCSEFGISLLC